MSNPGNVRKLNALGGKRPQATGIVLLPKNRSVLATSEGSVANYGGNSKMGLYSNVGMSYLFQNTQLTGARINGNMPYFWGRGAVTKPAVDTKNMITVNLLEDRSTIGFVADPYWTPISTALAGAGTIPASLRNSHMGDVNSKPNSQISTAGVIAIEKWRSTTYGGPSDNDVYIWLEEDAPINEVTFISEGVEVTLPVEAKYTRASPGPAGAVNSALTAGTFPAAGFVTGPQEFRDPDKAVAIRIGDGTANAKLNAIFPTSATAADVGNRKAVAIYFK